MKLFIIALALLSSSFASASSCLLTFNPRTYDYPSSTCVSASEWNTLFTSVDNYTWALGQSGPIVPRCTAGFGGNYFPGSDTCNDQGCQNCHLNPYL